MAAPRFIEIKTVAASTAPVRRRPSAAMLVAAALAGFSSMARPADPPSMPPANDPLDWTNDQSPWWARDKFDRSRLMNESSSHYILSRTPQFEPSFLFFPPVPPPLGSDIPLLAPFAPDPPAPQELAPFVSELFYPMLGARLAAGELPRALRAQIQTYRTTRDDLRNELRARIDALKDADPTAREKQLADLAALQAPRIAELRAASERLRTELRRTGVFGRPSASEDGGDISGGLLPPGRGAPPMPADLRLESEALRDAAFYQDGLSTSQRYLLREAAIELKAEADTPAAGAEANPQGRPLYFSPETARVRVPDRPPAKLEKMISEYVSSKNRLKAALLNAIRDNQDSGTARADAFKRLAATEAPPIAALELLAEAIRRDLAALPDPPGRPATPTLSPELTARISVYRSHKVELLRKLREMLAVKTVSNDSAPAHGSASASEWMRDGSTATEVQASDLSVSVAEFDRVQKALIAQLNKEQAGIREALSEYVRAHDRPTDSKSINDLLKDFEDARQRQEVWDKYRDYQAAVLMPGLSPEQRSLLFGAAVEDLALPLPAGESVR